MAKAPPDGYTICLGAIAGHAVSAALVDRLPYDLLADFQARTLLVNAPNIIVVRAGLPAHPLREYLDYATLQGRSTFLSGGLGTTSRLLEKALRVRQHAPLAHVPYRTLRESLSG